jgi:hypothetical protein
MKTISWDEVRRLRLARNFLTAPAERSRMLEVAGRVCGIQAQVVSAAELALGARVSGGSQADVQAALNETHELVKTYGPRGTLHLLPAGELPLWMAAMRAREALLEQPWYAAAGLDAAQADALLAAIGQALDGRSLTRAELASEVSRLAGAWALEKLASTWGECLSPAAFRGLLCFGPSQGSRVTFVRADQWTAVWQELEPEPALLEVLRRYIAAYGPAAASDFARWFWIKPGDAQGLIERLVGELAPVEIEGSPAWVLANQAEAPNLQAGPPRLLPQYDCYLLGSYPRERVVPEEARKRFFSYGRGRFEGAVGLPVLLIDGRVAGIWERKRRGKKLEIRVEAFVKLDQAQQAAVEADAGRIGEFLDTSIQFSLGNLA